MIWLRKLRVPWIAAVLTVLAVFSMFAGAQVVQAGSADETAVATFTPIDAMVAGETGQAASVPIAEDGSSAGQETAASQSARTAHKGSTLLNVGSSPYSGVASATS